MSIRWRRPCGITSPRCRHGSRPQSIGEAPRLERFDDLLGRLETPGPLQNELVSEELVRPAPVGRRTADRVLELRATTIRAPQRRLQLRQGEVARSRQRSPMRSAERPPLLRPSAAARGLGSSSPTVRPHQPLVVHISDSRATRMATAESLQRAPMSRSDRKRNTQVSFSDSRNSFKDSPTSQQHHLRLRLEQRRAAGCADRPDKGRPTIA
jgi:hypothetical protein